MYSKNANMNTTNHRPKPSGPEKNFRAYIDDQVDMMSRLSVNMLKFRIDMQREQDYMQSLQPASKPSSAMGGTTEGKSDHSPAIQATLSKELNSPGRDQPDYETKIIGQKYLLESTLKKTDGAHILLASDISSGRKHVVKIIRKKLDNGEENTAGLARARAEIDQLTRCKGAAHIVQLEDVIEDDEQIAIVMEYCEGGNLMVADEKTPDFMRPADVFTTAADALTREGTFTEEKVRDII